MTIPEIPEPEALRDPRTESGIYYTESQMKAYGQRCREAALEDAARLVEKYFDVNEPWMNPHDIRELK